MNINEVTNVRFYTDYPQCNFSCPYCVAGHAKEGGRDASPWDEERYFTIIDNLGHLDFPVNIRIGVGGEFFLSKPLVEGARRLSQSDSVVGLNLITNLSFSFNQYQRILDGFPHEKLALVASCHPSEIANLDAWIQVAAQMSAQYDLITLFVAYPPALHILRDLKQRLTDKGLEVFVQPFIGQYQGRSYPQAFSEEERDLIRSLAYSRHDHEYLLNTRRPGLCHAGARAFYVDPWGLAYPCGIGTYEQAIGNLAQSPTITLRDGPRPCPFATCQCDTENINTVDFHQHYVRLGINQHRYAYRFGGEAQAFPWMDEWHIRY